MTLLCPGQRLLAAPKKRSPPANQCRSAFISGEVSLADCWEREQKLIWAGSWKESIPASLSFQEAINRLLGVLCGQLLFLSWTLNV